MNEDYDFSGWATRNNIKCSDGRIIRKNAFMHNDGQKVPLVWNHAYNDPLNVLGHALLENRDEGVYVYGKFNNTENGQNAKMLVQHGDVDQLSIYANQLKQQGSDVIHGAIREVSLVVAGANPGAYIENVMAHSEDDGETAQIFTGEFISLSHADQSSEEKTEDSDNETVRDVFDTLDEKQKKAVYAIIGQIVEDDESDEEENEVKHSDQEPADDGETVRDVFNTLNEKQKKAVYVIIGQIVEENEDDEDEDAGIEHSDFEGGNETMKTNVFDQTQENEDTLQHSAIVANAIADAKRYGSMRESFIQHAATNNITNMDYLFPEPKSLNTPPEFIRDDTDWVSKVMNAVHHTPFSRVKSMFAQMDETEARARGYIKGKMKKDLALSVLKRTTLPTTVYIKMKMDRDDVVDITDFDVIAWQKAEMRGQLDRELARAMLIGDGRDLSSDDKINEQNIRPVLTDDDMYTIKYTVTDGVDYNNTTNSHSENDSVAKGVIRAAIKSRKEYKGSGQPTFFTTEDLLTELLLIEDQNGRRIYESVNTLATAMRVKEIVTVPEMEQLEDVYGIIVNMKDYNTGADKGGAVSMFDDFDIDYNQMKYLMETRMSGALVKPYSAIVLKKS